MDVISKFSQFPSQSFELIYRFSGHKFWFICRGSKNVYFMKGRWKIEAMHVERDRILWKAIKFVIIKVFEW